MNEYLTNGDGRGPETLSPTNCTSVFRVTPYDVSMASERSPSNKHKCFNFNGLWCWFFFAFPTQSSIILVSGSRSASFGSRKCFPGKEIERIPRPFGTMDGRRGMGRSKDLDSAALEPPRNLQSSGSAAGGSAPGRGGAGLDRARAGARPVLARSPPGRPRRALGDDHGVGPAHRCRAGGRRPGVGKHESTGGRTKATLPGRCSGRARTRRRRRVPWARPAAGRCRR